MAKGPRDTSSLVMLTGWDATALKNWQLQDGTSIDAVYNQLNAALGALNAELTSGLWGGLVSFQDQPDVEYRVGTSNGFEVHTEYGRPDAQRAATEGHMLPLIKYDRALGWTWDYLEDARMPQIQADIADAIKEFERAKDDRTSMEEIDPVFDVFRDILVHVISSARKNWIVVVVIAGHFGVVCPV